MSRTNRCSRVLALLVALSAGWVSTAEATVMVEVPLDEMVATADAVVVARVIQSESRLVIDPERGSEPHTFTTLRVDEWLVGAGSTTLTIEEIGGTLGNETTRIDGVPEFTPNDEVVLFIEQRSNGSLRTLAMAQGHFVVRRGVGQTPDSVVRDLDGIAFAHFSAGGMSVGHAHDEPAIELSVFLDTLRAMARTLASPTPSSSPVGGAL